MGRCRSLLSPNYCNAAKPPTCLVLVGGFSFACYFLACIFGVLCHRSPYRVEVDDWHIREVIGGI